MNLKFPKFSSPSVRVSETARGIMIGLVVAIFLFALFQFGVFVGYQKAHFSGRLGDNYRKNFENAHQGDPGDFFGGRMLPGGHGASGEIVSIALPKLVIAGPNNLEKTVVVNDETLVREFRNAIKTSDLKVGDHVVVLGTPDDQGQVNAKFIRVMPPPSVPPTAPEGSSSRSSVQAQTLLPTK
ncbi:MAG TPA: hypothetical protein VFM02_03560 [Candidatus Paceibacterota bacterium]|nr:hypothetical protein [Candidatus Paceibacterota bacterium]